MQIFSQEQVLALAPDASAATAGQGQAVRAKWSVLGRDDQVVWGECQGSGARPYRCQAALADRASRCSCPSRKLPCKHAIGLLLLLADGQVPVAACPDWVREWLAARADRQARTATASTATASAPPDPQALRRRAANREMKVDAGVEELRRWLTDLARGGLASAQTQQWEWWDRVARRMIDAQARGLANRLRQLAVIAAAGGHRPDWPERMLDEIGGLYLLCEAWTRRDTLPPDTTAALRARIGFTLTAAEVSRSGRRITDTWAVLGQRQDDESQIRSLQQWLYGERSGAIVSYLAFAAAGQPLEPGLTPGARTAATVVLYPGSLPHRVLIAERHDGGRPLGPLPGAAGWDEALSVVARVLAVDPWADVQPVAVREVTLLTKGSAPWLLRDQAGRAMPIATTEADWRLLALSGGAPVDVTGEWDGFAFTPQAAAKAGQDGQLLA